MPGIMYLLAFAIVLLSFLYMVKGKKKYTNLPPGPKPWPFVGNISYLKRQGVYVYELATKLRQDYGDVVRLRLGPKVDMILIMGKEKIQKAAVTMNDKFKYRPSNFFATDYVFKNRDAHAAMRKFTLGAMRDFGVGKKRLEERIQEEAGILEYDDPVLHTLIDKIGRIFKDMSSFLPENFFPALRFLPGSKLSKVTNMLNDLQKYTRGRTEEHRVTFDPDNIRDFVDLFLKHEGSEEGVVTEDNLFQAIVDLYFAGTDTTATAIVWAIIHLIRHPHIQDKCRKEVMEVVGTGRYISLEDKKHMPYLQAFISEVLRFSTIAPHVTRSVLEDTEFEGYTIPKKSIVIFIIYTLLMDKEIWGDPDIFRPERFLNKTGDRSCIGKHLAKMELFIFLGTLIQRFQFRSPSGKPPPSTRRIQDGITCQPERYEFCAIPLNK